VNAFFHLDQFVERARFATWLTKIAVQEALARARRRRPADENQPIDTKMVEPPSRLPDPEHQAFASEVGRMVEAAVDGHSRVPGDQRGYRQDPPAPRARAAPR
jgi:RNA polymerase sigma-70 factor, ECF subfamily